MSRPTDEQIRNFLAAALMCGESFTTKEYDAMADEYADGFKRFSGELNLLDPAGYAPQRWRVNEKGLKMLEDT